MILVPSPCTVAPHSGAGGSHSPLRRDSCSGGCHRTRPCWRRRGPACWGTRLPGWTRQRRPQKSPERPEEHCSALQGKLQNPHAALPAPTKSGLFPKSLRALDWGFRHIPRGRAGRAGENWMHNMPFHRGLHLGVQTVLPPPPLPPQLFPVCPQLLMLLVRVIGAPWHRILFPSRTDLQGENYWS